MIQLDTSWLQHVQKPARYTGGEYNSIVKNHSTVDITMALGFPDVYEVAMSHLGIKILYGLVNRREDAVAERVFAPWHDMEEEMRKRNIPLFSLETRTPIKDFDVLAFTLQYEMSFTNILNMLDLAGIPMYAKDRGYGFPIARMWWTFVRIMWNQLRISLTLCPSVNPKSGAMSLSTY